MSNRNPLTRFLKAARTWQRPDRDQVGAIPWRVGKKGPEVLLITSRGTGQWIIPKGGRMPGVSDAAAAAEEAWEEAGVRGTVAEEPVGQFNHLKTRLTRDPLHCRVTVYRLKVEEELKRWPERSTRSRRWFAVPDAARIVRSRELAALILDLVEA